MAVTTTPRLGLTRWSAGTDPLKRAHLDGDNGKLEQLAAIALEGDRVSRPAAGVRGRLYAVTAGTTERGAVYYDDGAAWHLVAPADYVTTGTAQTISATKTHSAPLVVGKVQGIPGGSVLLADDGGVNRAVVNGTGVVLGTTSPPSGVGVLAVNNAGTVPTTNPTTGVVVYAEGGVLKVRQTDGTVRTLDLDRATGVTLDSAQTIAGVKAFTTGAAVGGTAAPDGSGVLAVNNAAALPATNPTTGVVVYAEGGVLKVRQANGNIRTLDLDRATGVTLDSGQTIAGDKSLTGVTRIGPNGLRPTTGNVLTLRDQGGTVVRLVVSERGVTVGGTTPPDGAGVLAVNNAATVPTGNPTTGVVAYAEGGRLKVRDQAGKITTHGFAYSFQAIQTTNQSIAHAVDTRLLFQTITVDNSAAAHASGQFTLNRAGRWLIGSSVRFPSAASGERYLGLAHKDAAGATIRRVANQSGPAGVAVSLSTSGAIYAAAGDIVDTFVYQSSGAALSTDGGAGEIQFWGVWVGEA